MACLLNITADQILGCGPTFAPLARPVSAKLINADTIASFTVADGVATITRKPGTPAAASLECSNGATTIVVGVKGGEVAPQAPDVTITTKMFNMAALTSYGLTLSTVGANARVVIAVDHGNGIFRVYGLSNPLDCLNIEGDSEGTGFITSTFGVEDWQPGTSIDVISEADYVALSTPAP